MTAVTFIRDVRLNTGNVIPRGTPGTLVRKDGSNAVVEVSGTTVVVDTADVK